MPQVGRYRGGVETAPFRDVFDARPQIAAGTNALARGVDDVARALDEESHRLAVTEAKELDTSVRQQIQEKFYRQGQLYDMQGENAVRARPKAEEQLEKIRKDTVAKASPRAREIAGPGIDELVLSERMRFDRHALKQQNVWDDDASVARQHAAEQSALSLWNDETEYAKREQTMRSEIVTRGQRAGADPKVITEQTKTAESNLASAAVYTALQTSTVEALQLYERVESKIQPEAKAKLQRYIDDAKGRDLAQRAAGVGDVEAQAQYVEQNAKTPGERDEALRQISARATLQRQAKKDYEDNVYDGFVQDVRAGRVPADPTQIPFGLTDRYASARAFVESYARGQAPKDIPAERTRWNIMSDAERARQVPADWWDKLPESRDEVEKGIRAARKAVESGDQTLVGEVPREEVNRIANQAIGGIPRANKNQSRLSTRQYDLYYRNVWSQVDALGPKATRDQVQTIVDRALEEIVVDADAFENDKIRRFELTPETEFGDVPSEYLDQIGAALAREGSPVTVENIRKKYRQAVEAGRIP